MAIFGSFDPCKLNIWVGTPKQLDAMIEISTAVSGNLAQPHPESIR
jgi:hypothetical protein